ncbi:MAG: hypothetical protein ACRC50_03500 [Gaiella sp.]
MQRLRPLSEQECYLRCYGWLSTDEVRVLRTPSPAAAAIGDAVLTERIRRAYEARLADRDAEAA